MRVLVTGAGGFLGWHTRLRLHSQGHEIVAVDRRSWDDLSALVDGCEAVIHLAGVNRGTDDEVCGGNVRLAEDLVDTIRQSGSGPLRVVYANSIQAGNGTPYGSGKARGAEILGALADEGHHVCDVHLPNIFGEHGRPHYNSFVATFVHAVAGGDTPTVTDRQVELLHAQSAAQALIDGLTSEAAESLPHGVEVGVQAVLDLLHEFDNVYAAGDFPDLSSQFRVDLFNTYRAALFPQRYPIRLVPHTDARGTFVETVRSRGGEGQSSMSTTAPGITRGEHYHLSKIERFAVVQGHATIALRRMFHDDVIEFNVKGEEPCAIDMPVGWAHNITNTGDDVLITQFWSHEIYRRDAPDTFPEAVAAMVGAGL
ncbi:MAG: NAD-dependent epimerase/dehydratase family protein [Dermatophilaceae bacterium]